MPPTPQSPEEKRLQGFSKLFAVVYLLGAVFFAAAPGLTYRIASMGEASALSAEGYFWNALSVAMMVAISLSCWLVSRRPRDYRHALLPVIAAKLTSSVLGLVHMKWGRALPAIIVTDLPLFVLTLWVYRAAAPGVHSEPARAAPPPAEEPKPAVQLGVPK